MSVRRVPKPWGEEIIYAHTERYAGKILMIRGGESLSLQYHKHKDESIYLLRGSMRLVLQEGHLTPRTWLLFHDDERRFDWQGLYDDSPAPPMPEPEPEDD